MQQTSSPNPHFWNYPEFQILAGYLVSAWTFLEFTSFVLARFEISRIWSNILLDSILLFIPSVLLIAFAKRVFRNGKVQRIRRIFIPLNFIILISILFFSFKGADLGRMTEEVELTTLDGEVISERIVKNSFRDRIVIFDFKEESDSDSTKSWLKDGIPDALNMNFQQLQSVTSIGGQSLNQLITKTNGLSMIEELTFANSLNCNFLISGKYAFKNDSIHVTVQLLNQKGKVVDVIEVKEPSLFKLVDDLFLRIREQLPNRVMIRKESIYPFAEIFTNKEDAFKSFVLAISQRKFSHSDFDLTNCFQIDPAFAYGYREAMEYIAEAVPNQLYERSIADKFIKHSRKLPKRLEWQGKIFYYLIYGQLDNVRKLIENYSLLYKDNFLDNMKIRLLRKERDYMGLVNNIVQSGDPTESEFIIGYCLAASRKDKLEELIDSGFFEGSNYLSMAYLAIGEIEMAHEHFERLALENPADSSVAKILTAWDYILNPTDFVAVDELGQSIYHTGHLNNHFAIQFYGNLLLLNTEGRYYLNLPIDENSAILLSPLRDLCYIQRFNEVNDLGISFSYGKMCDYDGNYSSVSYLIDSAYLKVEQLVFDDKFIEAGQAVSGLLGQYPEHSLFKPLVGMINHQVDDLDLEKDYTIFEGSYLMRIDPTQSISDPLVNIELKVEKTYISFSSHTFEKARLYPLGDNYFYNPNSPARKFRLVKTSNGFALEGYSIYMGDWFLSQTFLKAT